MIQSLNKIDGFDVEKLKKYEFKMYEKRYREWDSEKCFYLDKDSKKVTITPHTL